MANYVSKDGLLYFWGLIKSKFATSDHVHGSITNDGKVGTTANKPLITGTNGVVTTGSFGTTANTFCQGNDSRLSNARTPTSHTHGELTNAGLLGAASVVAVTDGDKKLTTSSVTATELGYLAGVTSSIQTQLNSKQASGSYASSSHTHGNITNAGGAANTAPTIATGSTNGDFIVITDTSDSNKISRGIQFSGDSGKYLTASGTWATPPDNNTVTAIASTTGSGNAVTAISATNGQLTVTKGTTFLTSHQSLANYYTKSQVDGLVSGALHYKGTSATLAALVATVTAKTYTPATGDVWNITTAGGSGADGTAVKAGDNVAYNGSGWDVLGGTTDLSAYVQTSDLVAVTNSEIDTIVAS